MYIYIYHIYYIHNIKFRVPKPHWSLSPMPWLIALFLDVRGHENKAAESLSVASKNGWLSKLWSLFGYPKY